MSSLFHSSILTNSGCFVCLNFWYHYKSRVQQAYESNYAYSNKITHVIEVTPDQILFDAVPVVFSGNYLGRFFPGQNYPYYEDAAMGGQRFLNVKDNFGIWHSFAYRVPV